MRFTEHELTAAITAAAKTVAATQRGGRRRRSGDPEQVWSELGRYERYQVMDAVGSQVLPVLLALPDVDVEPGTRPTFSDVQVARVVEETMGEAGGKLRRKVAVAARMMLVKVALGALPPRQDPDALIVPDHL